MHVKCIQLVSTLTCEKIKCRKLNQTKTKMQCWGESKMCDVKWTYDSKEAQKIP